MSQCRDNLTRVALDSLMKIFVFLAFILLSCSRNNQFEEVYDVIMSKELDSFYENSPDLKSTKFVFITQIDTSNFFIEKYSYLPFIRVKTYDTYFGEILTNKYKYNVEYDIDFKKNDLPNFIIFKFSDILSYEINNEKFVTVYFEEYIKTENGSGGAGREYTLKNLENKWTVIKRNSVLSIN